MQIGLHQSRYEQHGGRHVDDSDFRKNRIYQKFTQLSSICLLRLAFDLLGFVCLQQSGGRFVIRQYF